MIPISKPWLGEAEKAAVMEVLDSGSLAQGAWTERLEQRFRDVLGVEHAVATSSGTTALHLALLAHGIGPGDEVVTSAFTFIASATSILHAGARPVFADVDAQTFNLDPRAAEAAISPRTKAIMPVHLYGQPCDMEALGAIARRHELVLIEDAAQAIGAEYLGKPAGTFGTAAFSLYATKNVTAAEGGMITTSDAHVAELARMLRNHGMKQRYRHEIVGYNFRISDVHAAIGLAQMDRLDGFLEQRRRHAAALSAGISRVITPRESAGCRHAWHQYTVRVTGQPDRDSAVERLARAGVGTGVYYPVPVHQQPCMRGIAHEAHLPVTEQLAREVLSLPVHPLLSGGDLQTIVQAVNAL